MTVTAFFLFRSTLRQPPARLHALMQHAHDLYALARPVEQHMPRLRHRRLGALVAAVPDMEAAHPRRQRAPVRRVRPQLSVLPKDFNLQF